MYIYIIRWLGLRWDSVLWSRPPPSLNGSTKEAFGLLVEPFSIKKCYQVYKLPAGSFLVLELINIC